MALTGIESLVGNLFNTTFGLPLVFGVIGILALIFFLVGLKLSFEASMVIALPWIFILSQLGFLPRYINAVLMLGGGILIFIAIRKIVR